MCEFICAVLSVHLSSCTHHILLLLSRFIFPLSVFIRFCHQNSSQCSFTFNLLAGGLKSTHALAGVRCLVGVGQVSLQRCLVVHGAGMVHCRCACLPAYSDWPHASAQDAIDACSRANRTCAIQFNEICCLSCLIFVIRSQLVACQAAKRVIERASDEQCINEAAGELRAGFD